MKKISGFDILTIISSIGIISWIATDFFGGMILYLLSYGIIIFPIIIFYIISIADTLFSIFKKNTKTSKIKLYFHLLVIFIIISLNIYHSDIFKSHRILTATLKDDQFFYTLIFRGNGKCENEIIGIFGFEQTYKGKYLLKGDTIIFSKKPYDNDFIPDTVLLDKSSNAIFITKDTNGHFIKQKEWLNHFEIK